MALVKHGDNKNIYFRFVIAGKIHFGSTKTANRTLAAKVERAKYEAAVAKKELGTKEVISTKAALTTFLDTQTKSGEYRNIKTYCGKLLGTKADNKKHDGSVIAIYGLDGGKAFHEVDTADIQRLILARRVEGNANATILLELVQLSKAVSLCSRLGYQVPVINLKELKQENQLRPSKKKLRYLTAEEEARLMAALDPSNLKRPELIAERSDMRDFVVVKLAIGARYSEIAKLKWSDISLANRTIGIYRKKTQSEGVLSMTDRVVATLTARLAAKRDDQIYVFENSDRTGHRKYAPKAFVNACERAGITGITLHSMRRTNASRLVQAGISLYSVAQQLGHKSSRTTEMHYAHLAPNQAAQQAADILNKFDAATVIKS